MYRGQKAYQTFVMFFPFTELYITLRTRQERLAVIKRVCMCDSNNLYKVIKNVLQSLLSQKELDSLYRPLKAL